MRITDCKKTEFHIIFHGLYNNFLTNKLQFDNIQLICIVLSEA